MYKIYIYIVHIKQYN